MGLIVECPVCDRELPPGEACLHHDVGAGGLITISGTAYIGFELRWTCEACGVPQAYPSWLAPGERAHGIHCTACGHEQEVRRS